MNDLSRRIQRTYLTLMLGNTLAASFIWGINTLFLLDAGLSNFQAFAANAFFTAGMVLCDIPTGVVADTWGRRVSYLLGTLTLSGATILYYLLWHWHAGFAAWAVVSILLGLGFTFFNGAIEAWLVDALHFAKYKGSLETIFGRGQTITGVGMLTGSVAGGVIAQATNLGVPYILRAIVLLAMFVVAWFLMKDLGFKPKENPKVLESSKEVIKVSYEQGLKNPPVRWIMLAAPFTAGVGIYAFYAAQPFLLQLYGHSKAYSIAGLAAAIVAGAQILGGLAAPKVRGLFKKRTTAMFLGVTTSTLVLALLSAVHVFWLALLLLVVWAIMFAALLPIRLAYINDMIPSAQRATVLSFDSTMGSTGGVVFQPILGKVADVYSYSASYLAAGLIQFVAVPFILLSRKQNSPADISVKVTPGHEEI